MPIIIAGRELLIDLVKLEIVDYDVILGMNFLGKYCATLDCWGRKVVFQPEGVNAFNDVDTSSKPQKWMISSLKARKIISSGCDGYLANVIDTSKEEKLQPKDVPIVNDFI